MVNSKLTRLRWDLSTIWNNDWEWVNIFLVFPIKKYLPKHISNAFTELGHNCIYLPTRSSPNTVIAFSYCYYCNCFHDAGNRILQKLFVLDKAKDDKSKAYITPYITLIYSTSQWSFRGGQIATLQWSHLCFRNSLKIAIRIFLFRQYLGTEQDMLFQIAKSGEKL